MKKIILFIFFAIALFSCGKEKSEKIVVSVNNEQLTLNEFKGNFTPAEWKNLSNDEKQEFVNQWIEMVLLSQAAENEKLVNAKLENKIKYSGFKIKGNAYISKTLNEIDVSDEELLNYYNINKNKYKTTKTELKIQQISSNSKSKINSVKQKIWDGLRFKQAAIEFSEDNFASNGGYAGFVSKEDLGEDIWKKLLASKKYVFIQAEKDDGHYLIRYYRTREVETIKTFLEVKDSLKIKVIQLKKEDIFNKIIKNLKQNAEIEISNI